MLLNSFKIMTQFSVCINLLHYLCFSAYHGHLTSIIEISPYKFNQPGCEKKPDYVHVVKYLVTYILSVQF